MQLFSDAVLPMVIALVIIWGLGHQNNVYESFLTGARSGLRLSLEILPTLIGLLVAVGLLRASGFFEILGEVFGPVVQRIGIVPEILNLSLIKMFSSSAATGMLLDIFKNYGVDSVPGQMGALILSSTETLMYTMSVYFGTVKVTKTRYTLPGALLASAAGVCASILLVLWGMK